MGMPGRAQLWLEGRDAQIESHQEFLEIDDFACAQVSTLRLTMHVIGMWCRRRPCQSEEDVRKSYTASRWTRYRKDGPSAGNITRTWNKSAVLPDCSQRDLFDGSEEDGSIDGELSTSYWYVKHSSKKAVGQE